MHADHPFRIFYLTDAILLTDKEDVLAGKYALTVIDFSQLVEQCNFYFRFFHYGFYKNIGHAVLQFSW